MSSMTVDICGSSSLTSMPLWPDFLNSNGEGSRPPVWRSVRRLTESGRWPACLARIGLGIEHVDLRRAAGHEQEDDVLGLGRQVRAGVVAQRIGMPSLAEQGREAHRTQAAAKRLDHSAPRKSFYHGQKISSLVESRICAYCSSRGCFTSGSAGWSRIGHGQIHFVGAGIARQDLAIQARALWRGRRVRLRRSSPARRPGCA